MSTVSAVIFDLDGTLTQPYLDFDEIRAEIGGITGPILEAIQQMDDAARCRAEKILTRHEREAAERAALCDGALETIEWLRRRSHPVAILTRNSRASVRTVTARFGIAVDALRTRDDGVVKPSPEPVLSLCRTLRADPRRSWVVGDYLFDILSGRAAGTRTVLVLGERPAPDYANQADYVIRGLKELRDIISNGAQHLCRRSE